MDTTLAIFIAWIVLTIFIFSLSVTSLAMTLSLRDRINKTFPPDDENIFVKNWSIFLIILAVILAVFMFAFPITREFMGRYLTLTIMTIILIIFGLTIALIENKNPELLDGLITKISLITATALYIIALLIAGLLSMMNKSNNK